MKLRPNLARLLAGTCVIFSAGCALATKGRKQEVSITSSPAGATVVVDGVAAGQTPLITNLPRKTSHHVEVRKDGFAPASLMVRALPNEYARRFVRWGADIDLGAAYDLTPASLNLDLTPEPLAGAAYGDAYERMIYAVLAADTLQENGRISDADHRDMIAKIIARYSGRPR